MKNKQRFRFTIFTLLFGLVISTIIACSSFLYGEGFSLVSKQEKRSPVIFEPSEELALGTNISSIVDWSTQLPFVDAFKTARRWMPQCLPDELGCSGSWATDEYNLLDLDGNGWVRSLPNPEDSPEYTRMGTLMFREIQGRYPGGRYIVLYEGEGNIDYEFDASKDELVSRPGRDVLEVV